MIRYDVIPGRREAPSPESIAPVAAIVRTHIRWVMENQSKARFMLDDARAAWFAKAAPHLKTYNTAFGAAVERWRAPLVARGLLRDLPVDIFLATLIGPANLICRGWVTGRKLSATSPAHSEQDLIALAQQALVMPAHARTRKKKHAK